ncbi:Zn-dependent peptidase ImmA, M78 family [Streptomyces zhaozhouensis]|uniref:Zn-dependent peptidase ImmA, M78 family n=1 Tax=Streptomyces zhaozhouensis TaxID=1300267 RepID=A0A286E875_9ACTN|nr:Zn-dependent peptidase ImmA, M78 family [Streptomyces zhaozhouensis]
MFTPERLVLARKRRRMTLAALEAKAGVSQQSINAFEKHRRPPSDRTLSSLAQALGFPTSFFHADPPPEILRGAVSFRAPSKMSAAERDSALAAGSIAATLNAWLEDRFALPEPNVPAYTYPQPTPEQAAEMVREHWGLGEAPAPNMVHLLEANGVRVFSIPPDCLEIDAFSTTKNGRPFVFLNTRKTAERGRFDAAHELGHLVLHNGHHAPHGPDPENEANRFASAFLMPRSGILAQQLHNPSVERVLSAKRRWDVSAMALTYRLYRMELLSEWRFNQANKQLASLGFRRGEPGSKVSRETSQLLAKVFEALRDDRMTAADIAAEMAITVADLNEYVFGLVPTQVTGGGRTTPAARPSLQLIRS